MTETECEKGSLDNQDLSIPDVVTKYSDAGKIANQALHLVIEAVKAGGNVVDLCKLGDAHILAETAKIYKKKREGQEIDKGIAFPTCISVNELCGNFCPLEDEEFIINDGDLVKVELGCHIDGFVCVAGHSIVVGESKVVGRKADVMRAAWVAAEAALRSVVVGQTNTQVTRVIESVAKQFNCNPVHGLVSHRMKRHVIAGNQCIANSEQNEEKVEEFTFGANEVYGIDIVMSTGEGKIRQTERKARVYKRAVDVVYQLRNYLARSFLNEVNTRFPALPFTVRSIESQKALFMGIAECTRNHLLQPYEVMTEKPGQFIARFKFTVLLLPGGSKKATGISFDQDSIIESEHKIEDEAIKALLVTPKPPKKHHKKPKNQGEEGQEKTSEHEDEE